MPQWWSCLFHIVQAGRAFAAMLGLSEEGHLSPVLFMTFEWLRPLIVCYQPVTIPDPKNLAAGWDQWPKSHNHEVKSGFFTDQPEAAQSYCSQGCPCAGKTSFWLGASCWDPVRDGDLLWAAERQPVTASHTLSWWRSLGSPCLEQQTSVATSLPVRNCLLTAEFMNHPCHRTTFWGISIWSRTWWSDSKAYKFLDGHLWPSICFWSLGDFT